jgi:hypothetical protein
MLRAAGMASLMFLANLPSASAQQPPAGRFRWQPGAVLTYRVEHRTTVTETVGGTKLETSSRLNLVKRWQVLSVDTAGTATLKMSLAALRTEQTRPEGGVILFDSDAPDKSTPPELKEQMAPLVGKPLAVLRVDNRGVVVEVKDSQFGPASRFESEPPFVVTFGNVAPAAGAVWERNYAVTLDPPQSTGEKYEAVQKYGCQTVAGNLATIALTTQFKKVPESALDRVPLIQRQPRGEVVFDLANGRMHSANLRIEEELQNHQGPGSSYRCVSSYTEQYGN